METVKKIFDASSLKIEILECPQCKEKGEMYTSSTVSPYSYVCENCGHSLRRWKKQNFLIIESDEGRHYRVDLEKIVKEKS